MNEKLKAEKEWGSLIETLNEGKLANDFEFENQYLESLRKALVSPTDMSLSPKDKLVRLRQVLRFGDLILNRKSLPLTESIEWLQSEDISKFNLAVNSEKISAKPWEPKWIDGSENLDNEVMGLVKKPWGQKHIEADPWMKDVFGFNNYNSAGQALAVRSVLNMPEDKTLLVILPTGEGKSLIYQALWQFQKRFRCCAPFPGH